MNMWKTVCLDFSQEYSGVLALNATARGLNKQSSTYSWSVPDECYYKVQRTKF